MGYEFLRIRSWGRDYTKSKKYNLIELWIRPVSLSLFDLQRFTAECGTSTRYRFVDKVVPKLSKIQIWNSNTNKRTDESINN